MLYGWLVGGGGQLLLQMESPASTFLEGRIRSRSSGFYLEAGYPILDTVSTGMQFTV